MKKEIKMNMSRRRFFQSGAIALPLLVSGSTLGLAGTVSASNRTTVALVGVGCLGQGHLNTLSRNPQVEMLGISDVDQWRLDNGMQIVKDAYAARNDKALPSCTPYHDFTELIVRDDIDALACVMGDRWHSTFVKTAVQLGKDVFVEKPCALTVDECLSMPAAVRAGQRICQIGLQQRSDTTFAFACDIVRSGRLGKISHVYVVHGSCSREVELPAEPVPSTLDWDRWLGPCPWREYNHQFHYLGYPKNVVPWEFCRDFGNGGIASGGVHAWDVVNWGLKMDQWLSQFTDVPQRYPSFCSRTPIPNPDGSRKSVLECYPAGTSDRFKYTTFVYPNGIVAQIVNGRLDKNVDYLPDGAENLPVEPFGAVFCGENGWISVGRKSILKASSPELIEGVGPMFLSHTNNWIQCIRSRNEPTCPIERGCEATIMTTIGSMALWLNRPLKFDLIEKRFLEDEMANRLRSRTPRGNWIV